MAPQGRTAGPQERAYLLADVSLAGFAASALLAAVCAGPIAGVCILVFSGDLVDFGHWPRPVGLWFMARASYLLAIWCGFHGLWLNPGPAAGRLRLAVRLSMVALGLGILGYMFFPRVMH